MSTQSKETKKQPSPRDKKIQLFATVGGIVGFTLMMIGNLATGLVPGGAIGGAIGGGGGALLGGLIGQLVVKK